VPRNREGRGFAWTAAGFILAVIGFGVLLYEIWSTATIPLNDVTFAGMGIAGAGIAVGAIGIDRGETRAAR
jgi:hypothetical protein